MEGKEIKRYKNIELPDELKAYIDAHVAQHMEFYTQQIIGDMTAQQPPQAETQPPAVSDTPTAQG